jgi:hypothetical protein
MLFVRPQYNIAALVSRWFPDRSCRMGYHPDEHTTSLAQGADEKVTSCYDGVTNKEMRFGHQCYDPLVNTKQEWARCLPRSYLFGEISPPSETEVSFIDSK